LLLKGPLFACAELAGPALDPHLSLMELVVSTEMVMLGMITLCAFRPVSFVVCGCALLLTLELGGLSTFSNLAVHFPRAGSVAHWTLKAWNSPKLATAVGLASIALSLLASTAFALVFGRTVSDLAGIDAVTSSYFAIVAVLLCAARQFGYGLVRSFWGVLLACNTWLLQGCVFRFYLGAAEVAATPPPQPQHETSFIVLPVWADEWCEGLRLSLLTLGVGFVCLSSRAEESGRRRRGASKEGDEDVTVLSNAFGCSAVTGLLVILYENWSNPSQPEPWRVIKAAWVLVACGILQTHVTRTLYGMARDGLILVHLGDTAGPLVTSSRGSSLAATAWPFKRDVVPRAAVLHAVVAQTALLATWPTEGELVQDCVGIVLVLLLVSQLAALRLRRLTVATKVMVVGGVLWNIGLLCVLQGPWSLLRIVGGVVMLGMTTLC